jgi:hypothetical protein
VNVITMLEESLRQSEMEGNPYGRSLLKVAKILAKAVDPATTPEEAATHIEGAGALVWKKAQAVFAMPEKKGMERVGRRVAAPGWWKTHQAVQWATNVIRLWHREEAREAKPLRPEHHASIVQSIYDAEMVLRQVKERADRFRMSDEDAAALPRRRVPTRRIAS